MTALEWAGALRFPFEDVDDFSVWWRREDDVCGAESGADNEDGVRGSGAALRLREVVEQREEDGWWWDGVGENAGCEDEVLANDDEGFGGFAALDLHGEAIGVAGDALDEDGGVDGRGNADGFRVGGVVRGDVAAGGADEIWCGALVHLSVVLRKGVARQRKHLRIAVVMVRPNSWGGEAWGRSYYLSVPMSPLVESGSSVHCPPGSGAEPRTMWSTRLDGRLSHWIRDFTSPSSVSAFGRSRVSSSVFSGNACVEYDMFDAAKWSVRRSQLLGESSTSNNDRP